MKIKVCLVFAIAVILMFAGVRSGIISFTINKAEVMKEYSAVDGKYKFSIPESWSFHEESFEGGEITYHGDFRSADNEIRGFVQEWSIDMPLEKFLKNSKFSATGNADLKNYSIKRSKLGKYNGFALDYIRKGNDNVNYRAQEYFVPVGNNKIFRISFFIKEDNYNTRLRKMIDDIINSVIIK